MTPLQRFDEVRSGLRTLEGDYMDAINLLRQTLNLLHDPTPKALEAQRHLLARWLQVNGLALPPKAKADETGWL